MAANNFVRILSTLLNKLKKLIVSARSSRRTRNARLRIRRFPLLLRLDTPHGTLTLSQNYSGSSTRANKSSSRSLTKSTRSNPFFLHASGQFAFP